MKIELDFLNFSFFWFYESFMCQIYMFSEANRAHAFYNISSLINYETSFQNFNTKYNFTTFTLTNIKLLKGGSIIYHIWRDILPV